MEWMEVNCLLEALDALIAKYHSQMSGDDLSEDDKADLSNDLAYAEVLRGKYRELRDEIGAR